MTVSAVCRDVFTRGRCFMHIHTLCEGETIADAAKIYGVSEATLMANNGLINARVAVGEELLILTPTRTYTVKHGDTPERLSLRFGITRRELYAQNPIICERGLRAGDEVALKYDDAPYGMGVSNGYFYKGCTTAALCRALPYLTYVTFASALESGGEIQRIFDDTDAKLCAIQNEKIPLLRIYRRDSVIPSGDAIGRLCDAMIKSAVDGGYRGIVLSECSGEGYDKFIVELRGRMIGCDLILISEMSEGCDVSVNEYSDGSILSFDKYTADSPQSFADGERRIYSDFACNGESSKTFISLPSMARWGRGYCSITDALATARQYGCKIVTDGDSLISSFVSERRGNFSFTSLKNIKAILDIISEYDFMGVSFDIMRAPVSHLLMYNNLFRTAQSTSARSAEGCSRGG